MALGAGFIGVGEEALVADTFALTLVKRAVRWALLAGSIDFSEALLALAFISVPLVVGWTLLAGPSNGIKALFADAAGAIPLFVSEALHAGSSSVEMIA